jgi:hypothetical protein
MKRRTLRVHLFRNRNLNMYIVFKKSKILTQEIVTNIKEHLCFI